MHEPHNTSLCTCTADTSPLAAVTAGEDVAGEDAPGKEELYPELLKRAKIVVDDWEQASYAGEINVPLTRGIITKENIWGEIGEVVAGLKPGRTSADEITIFDSTGLAIQDAVTAKLVYEKALAKNLGKLVEI